ncbi:MAG: hypothetical protein EU550_03160 [Promethearchaeota archaeon]|nr:MAG: hypothetical protein EU550_03160 [Candidatus Lokiarchaeota archaeon]
MDKDETKEIEDNIIVFDGLPYIKVEKSFFYFKEDFVLKEPLTMEKLPIFTQIQSLKEKNSLKDITDELKRRFKNGKKKV